MFIYWSYTCWFNQHKCIKDFFCVFTQMSDDLMKQLNSYKAQLQQVEVALSTDQENEDLLKLQKDLQVCVNDAPIFCVVEGIGLFEFFMKTRLSDSPSIAGSHRFDKRPPDLPARWGCFQCQWLWYCPSEARLEIGWQVSGCVESGWTVSVTSLFSWKCYIQQHPFNNVLSLSYQPLCLIFKQKYNNFAFILSFWMHLVPLMNTDELKCFQPVKVVSYSKRD